MILENQLQGSYVCRDHNVTYLCEHFVSFLKVIEQYGDLGFIGTPGQEFAKSPLHALHFRGLERGRTECYQI